MCNTRDSDSSPQKRRPGIAFVRPKLHDNTQESRDLFKRWAKLHMRDTLSVPKDEHLGGASRVLRYTRATEEGGEEYLFTIVLDVVNLPGTEAFQKVPLRLDLENTRALHQREEPVLKEGDPRIGTNPMIFSIVSPSVGIFEAVPDCQPLPPHPKAHALILQQQTTANTPTSLTNTNSPTS